jgi:hypothetical protein
MSQHMGGIMIDRLLADERLRERFAVDRIETLALLSLAGIELTPDEFEAFMQADARLWLWDRGVVGNRVH